MGLRIFTMQDTLEYQFFSYLYIPAQIYDRRFCLYTGIYGSEKTWKFIQIVIRDTKSYSDSDSYSLFHVFAHSNLLLNNDSYKKSLFPLYFWYELQIIFLSDVTFPSWPGKSVKLNFLQYQSDGKNDKFACCLHV